MEKNEKEVTTSEIMEYLQGDLMGFLQEHMVTQEEFKALDNKLDGLSVKLNQTKFELLDAMDEKIATLKGDLVVLMRGEDKKLSVLVEVLAAKNVLSRDEAQSILAMQPFPQMTRS